MWSFRNETHMPENGIPIPHSVTQICIAVQSHNGDFHGIISLSHPTDTSTNISRHVFNSILFIKTRSPQCKFGDNPLLLHYPSNRHDHDNVSGIHARTKEASYSDQIQTERKDNIILLFIWPTNDGPRVTRVFVDVVCPSFALDSCSVLWTLRTPRHESLLTVILAKTRTPHLIIAEDAAACIHH